MAPVPAPGNRPPPLSLMAKQVRRRCRRAGQADGVGFTARPPGKPLGSVELRGSCRGNEVAWQWDDNSGLLYPLLGFRPAMCMHCRAACPQVGSGYTRLGKPVGPELIGGRGLVTAKWMGGQLGTVTLALTMGWGGVREMNGQKEPSSLLMGFWPMSDLWARVSHSLLLPLSPLQRHARARTWRTWGTGCGTGSSSFMRTPSRTALRAAVEPVRPWVGSPDRGSRHWDMGRG